MSNNKKKSQNTDSVVANLEARIALYQDILRDYTRMTAGRVGVGFGKYGHPDSRELLPTHIKNSQLNLEEAAYEEAVMAARLALQSAINSLPGPRRDAVRHAHTVARAICGNPEAANQLGLIPRIMNMLFEAYGAAGGKDRAIRQQISEVWEEVANNFAKSAPTMVEQAIQFNEPQYVSKKDRLMRKAIERFRSGCGSATARR